MLQKMYFILYKIQDTSIYNIEISLMRAYQITVSMHIYSVLLGILKDKEIDIRRKAIENIIDVRKNNNTNIITFELTNIHFNADYYYEINFIINIYESRLTYNIEDSTLNNYLNMNFEYQYYVIYYLLIHINLGYTNKSHVLNMIKHKHDIFHWCYYYKIYIIVKLIKLYNTSHIYVFF